MWPQENARCEEAELHGNPAWPTRAENAPMPLTEYKPGQAFPGVIGRTFDVSKPAWPEPNRAKSGAPNVLFIVLDDTGFGHLGCYGSPIRTPHIDALAKNGLRYINMHTTALCSPSRTCFITGRNHHSNGMSCIEACKYKVMPIDSRGVQRLAEE